MAEQPDIAAPIPGSALADAGWLGARIDETARTWACGDRRVIGTLWWYMATSTLLEVPLHELARSGAAPDPALQSLTCTVRADGSLATVAFTARLDGIPVFAAVLRRTLASIIDALADVSGAGNPSLWAIASDALGNRALEFTRDPETGAELALAVAAGVGDAMPTPRFVDIGGRRFVRRGSCCLIYETAKADKCISCPRRAPEERAGLLAELVRRGR